tara:strand:+ start:63 stop:491 length:429 start_codon:yes stop_codon:yes gene_type:complete
METKIIKLNNGDELVATISSTDGEFIKVENPLKINVYPKYRKNGQIEEAMAFSQWMKLSENQIYDVVKNNVVAITESSVGLTKFYEYCVKKMEKQKLPELRQPSKEELDKIEQEFVKKFLLREQNEDYDDDDFDEPTSKTIH